MEKEDSSKISCQTYVATGAVNIGNIEHVENLFPGNPEMIASVLGGKKVAKKELTDDDLRDKINAVMPRITSNRHWFAIIKVLMLKGKVAYDNFEDGEKLVKRLFPAGYPHAFDPADLKKLHDGSFRLPLGEWQKETSPYKRDAEFKQMFNLATDFNALFD